MKIRNTQNTDLKRVMEIYAGAREFMKKTGNPLQWGPTNWPPEALIQKDIENQKSYVCLNDADNVVGVFFFDHGEKVDPMYNTIYDGEWKGNDTYGVVHRIASDGSEKGIGTFCIIWAFEQCKHLRMDTHGDNKVMQNLLLKLGFEKCGIIYVQEDDFPRIAYEKK